MLVLGFVLSAFMGILLGMLGGGGSIVTIPILVYVLGVSEDLGPSYSLFVVGVASSIGAFQYVRLRQFSLQAALVYGIPSVAAVYFDQAYVLQWIPLRLQLFGHGIPRSTVLMELLAVMMLVAAWSMVRRKSRQTPETFDFAGKTALKLPNVALAGLLEGLFTGLVGAGGGFLIVPALVTIAKLPIKKAVGTSLLVMAIKSLIGFGGALQHIAVDWKLLLPFTGIAIVGILVGTAVSKKLAAPRIKLMFGWFVLGMGIFVAVKTILRAAG